MTTVTTPTDASSRPVKPLTDELPDSELIRWLRDMMLIREFEIRTMQAYANAQIGGFCHIY
ncbi:MAG: pyruvate dehydrogenase (acetyl-transferring) E1 component subunit alpha, partial [Planctomycetota bacterium]